jgi:hypothetical protein
LIPSAKSDLGFTAHAIRLFGECGRSGVRASRSIWIAFSDALKAAGSHVLPGASTGISTGIGSEKHWRGRRFGFSTGTDNPKERRAIETPDFENVPDTTLDTTRSPESIGNPRKCWSGTPGRTRTFNQLIKSQLLCQLSYRGDLFEYQQLMPGHVPPCALVCIPVFTPSGIYFARGNVDGKIFRRSCRRSWEIDVRNCQAQAAR